MASMEEDFMGHKSRTTQAAAVEDYTVQFIQAIATLRAMLEWGRAIFFLIPVAFILTGCVYGTLLYGTLLLSLPCAFPLLHQERVPLREKVPDTFSEGTA
jgi:hypothetical protein